LFLGDEINTFATIVKL